MDTAIAIAGFLAFVFTIILTIATYYHKQSLMVWSTYLTIVFGLLVPFLYWQKSVWSKNDSAPFTVSPEKVNLLAPQGHKAIQEIFIHNRTQVAYYDVWVKVTVNSAAIKVAKIEINRPDATPINLVDRDPAKALNSLLIVTIPDPGTNFFRFSVGRLSPNETKRYVFSYQNDGELSDDVEHNVILSLDRFTINPPPHGSYQSFEKEAPDARPNIVLKHVKLVKNPEGRPAATIALSNIGGNAFQFSCIGTIFGASKSEAEKFRPANIPFQNTVDLAPGEWVDQTLAMKPVDQSWKESFVKGDIGLYVWGEAKYRDGTGNWFHYDFCQSLNPKTELWESCPFHNRSY